MFTRIKGTNDFLDMTLFDFVIEQAHKHLALYHFSHIETPVLESTDLFKRSLGTGTDVVSKEMFLVKTHSDDNSICLRPEVTASIARAFVENGVQTVPWKVFTYGPMFRYERPQKGRFRQFHQLSIEVIGSKSVSQDAEFIMMLDRFLHESMKLVGYELQINYLGCVQDRNTYKEVLKTYLDAQGDALCARCQERKQSNILRVFDCKEDSCQRILEKAPMLIDYLCAPCRAEWDQLCRELTMLGVTYVIKPTLVRGLDYYQKTVFEFSSNNLGAQNAFCGGGRYDQLVGQVGGKEDQPSIGAAIGIERLLLLLESHKDTLKIGGQDALHVIVPLDDAQQSTALLLANTMRSAGLCTEVLFDGSIKSKMRRANKVGAAFVLLIGEDESKHNQVTVKNMITGEQNLIAQSDVITYLKK